VPRSDPNRNINNSPHKEMYRRFTTIAGKTIITRITDSSRIRTGKARKPKTNPTPDAVKKINRMNQERELTAKLNASFTPGDWWITLSHQQMVTPDESLTLVGKLKRGLQRYCKKHQIPFRLIETMGIGSQNGKPHHHIVLNKEVPLEVLYRYWPEEDTFAQPLKGYNYQKVAAYMMKNAEESKDCRGKHKKAFRCSRQVSRPEPRVEQMKRQATFDTEDLKAREGYAIDRDSIRKYEHPITGACCLEYIEVSLEPQPRIKQYYKGRPAKWEPLYPEEWGEQLSIDDILA